MADANRSNRFPIVALFLLLAAGCTTLLVDGLTSMAEEGNRGAQVDLGRRYEQGRGVPADPVRAAELYLKAAEQGDAAGQFYLALLYDQGKGIPRDPVRAAFWYRKAAEQGDPASQVNLGNLYVKGDGVPRNPGEAMEWYRRAATQGSVNGQLNLAEMYLHEHDAPRDATQAASWYRKAAEQDSVRAQHALGLLYLRGEGLPRDPAQAAAWFRKAADDGNAESQYYLATQYWKGNGLPRDPERAADWHRKAAEQGFGFSQLDLGVLYERGEGVERDFGQAAAWYRKAADQGVSGAQVNLGNLHLRGDGVPRDFAEAAGWFKRAAERNNATAQVLLGILMSRGEGVPRDKVAGAKWITKAAKQKNAFAEGVLGALYDQGEGVPQSYAKAFHWSKQAAENGDIQSLVNLGEYYEYGKAVSADLTQARGWYEKAAFAGISEAQAAFQRIGRGSWGTRDLQQKLSRLGFDPGPVNGKFGPGTQKALDRYGSACSWAASSKFVTAMHNLLEANPDEKCERSKGGSKPPPDQTLPVAPTGTQYALLFAVEDYPKYPASEQLRSPIRDATDLWKLLVQRFGFATHYEVVSNPSKEEILEKLDDVGERLGPDDSLVVFFSGHGKFDLKSREGYWLPSDAAPEDTATWISNIDVNRRMSVSQNSARHVLMIVDSCWSGAMLNEQRKKGVDYLGDWHRKRSRTVLTASRATEEALDGDRSRNSIFMKAVIETLGNLREPERMGALYPVIQRRVGEARLSSGRDRQTPMYGSPPATGIDASEQGDFVFYPGFERRAAR